MLRIKSIKFKNHPIFKNKEFDFTLYNGNAAENIIIIGENGTGKTNFIKELSNFFYINNYERNFDSVKFHKIIRELKFIENIAIELTFNKNDVLIPSKNFKNIETENLKKFNDIYIISDWTTKELNIRKFNSLVTEERILEILVNSEFSKWNINFLKLFNSKKFLIDKKLFSYLDFFDINEIDNISKKNYEEWKLFISSLKNENLKINFIIKSFEPFPDGDNRIYIEKNNENFNFIVKRYSIIDELSLKINNQKNFNSTIFWNDNAEVVWNKIEDYINKLIDDKKISLVDLELKDPLYSLNNDTLYHININEIVNKNLFYNDGNIIENVHKWIKQEISEVLNNTNLSIQDNNLNDTFYNSLKPLIMSISNFFNDKSDNIKISKINWDNSNTKNVVFYKNNSEIFFEQLSSGEKLILSICMSILSKLKSSSNNDEQDLSPREEISKVVNNGLEEITKTHTILLFDEIESGLHPKWQSKILELIKNTSQGVGQRFLTTHSPIVCYSINPETDIIINLNDEIVNNQTISFKNYSSIQDCVNKSLNFDYRELSDEHDVWVEGLSDKLYLDIAKKQIEELVPFNILANEHSKSDHGLDEWSGSKFILKKILLDFLFNKSEDTRKKHLIAIVDGDVLKNDNNELIYNMEFIMNQFREKNCDSKENQKLSEERRILRKKLKENISNFDNLNHELNSYKNKDWEIISLNIIRSKDNKLLQLVILKEHGIEYYLDSKDEVLNDLISDYKKNKCKDKKYQIENFIRTNDNKTKLDTTKLEKILKVIKDNVKN